MASLQYVVLFLALVVSIHASVSDEIKEKIRENLKPAVEKCSKELSIPIEDLKAAKANGKLADVDPCFHACMFKTTGLMSDKGLFNVDVAIEKNKKYLTDAAQLQKAADIANSCVKVNSETVTDGEKGCDRAKLLFNCLIPQTDAFVF